MSQLLFPFCKKSGSQGKCDVCVEGYSTEFSDGTCRRKEYPKLANCQIMETGQRCLMCVEGYYQDQGGCMEKRQFEGDPGKQKMMSRFREKIAEFKVDKQVQTMRVNFRKEHKKIEKEKDEGKRKGDEEPTKIKTKSEKKQKQENKDQLKKTKNSRKKTDQKKKLKKKQKKKPQKIKQKKALSSKQKIKAIW